MEEKNKTTLFIITGIVVLALSILIYILAFIKLQAGELSENFEFYTAIFTTVWALISTIIFSIVMKDFTFANPSGKVWAWLGLGVLFFFLGEFCWTLFIGMGIDPFPSIADIFYIIGYPFLYIGLISQLRLNKVEILPKEKSVTILVSAIVLTISSVIMIVPVYQSFVAEEITLAEMVITIIYPILDIVLTPFAVIIFFKFKGGEFGKSWLLISIGFIIMIAADLLFGWGYYLEIDNVFFLFDHFYNLSYFLLAIGAYQIHSSLKSI
jgi:hypothetical protein